MNDIIETLRQIARTREGMLSLIASIVITLSSVAVFSAVLLNFIICGRRQEVKRERRSFVATGSMILFFVFLYGLVRMRIGVLPIGNPALQITMVAVGLSLVVAGCIVNIMGRLRLGLNWANQATIYSDQRLVVSGVYTLVRHPLYASLIWMFYGAGIVYANMAVILANSLIFLPFMYYRARLEEELLAREFPEYASYRQRVGMFFIKPALRAHKQREERQHD